MDTTLAGLIHDCAARPDDTVTPLILADWLEDHGQDQRGELVRLQCRLAEWVPDVEERQDLLARQGELIAAHSADWLGHLAGMVTRYEFARGLVRLTLRSGTLARKSMQSRFAEVAETALVEQIHVTHCTSPQRVVRSPLLDWIPVLSLEKLDLEDDTGEILATSPQVRRLAGLNLANNRLGADGVQDLLDSGALQRLTWLDLRNNTLDRVTIDRLVQTALRLDLTGNLLLENHATQLNARLPAHRCLNSLGMEFIRIPAGSFLMGSPASDPVARENERPQHRVTLTRPFWMGRFPVTQTQFRAVTGNTPSLFPGDTRRAVDNVTWNDAIAFCETLGSRPSEVAAGRSYHLPTEAEWEHACRAGEFGVFHHGLPPSAEFVNYDGRYNYGGAPPGPYLRRTNEVGAYPPNAWGLHEMHGNVWEWCSDWYDEGSYTAEPAIDPHGPERGILRVRRGGCWDAIGSYCRTAHRNGQNPTVTNHFTGFRVVLVQS